MVAAPKRAMRDKTDTCPMNVAIASKTSTPYTYGCCKQTILIRNHAMVKHFLHSLVRNQENFSSLQFFFTSGILETFRRNRVRKYSAEQARSQNILCHTVMFSLDFLHCKRLEKPKWEATRYLQKQHKHLTSNS